MCTCKVSHIGTRPESLLVWLPRITKWCWMFSLSPAQFVKAIKTPDKHLTIVTSTFFSNTVKMLKLFTIMVTTGILSWVHWLYKQRQWESSPQSVMVERWITIGSYQKVITEFLRHKLDTNIKFESWNTGKVMDLMLSVFYIYLALNMSMLVTDCLKFISQISISCSVLSKDRIKGFI